MHLQTMAGSGKEKFITTFRESGNLLLGWPRKQDRPHRMCSLVKYAQTQTPAPAFKGWDYTSPMNLGEAQEGEDLYQHQITSPAAIASLILIHLNHDSNLAWSVG